MLALTGVGFVFSAHPAGPRGAEEESVVAIIITDAELKIEATPY